MVLLLTRQHRIGVQPAEIARYDDLPHFAYAGAGTTGPPAEELHTVPLCCLNHPLSLSEADGHGLFDNDVLTPLSGQKHVGAVARVGRGDPVGIR